VIATLILLLVLGIVHDVLWAIYLKCVANNQSFWASVVSFIITVMSFTVFASILDAFLHGSYLNLLFYAFGGALGTFGILHWKNRKG
jgi:multidrug transporter EmrE-like cation transporter